MTVFIIIWSVWFASELILNRTLRSGQKDMKGQDRGSLWFIWGSVAAAIVLAVYCAMHFNYPMSNSLIIPYTGLFIIIAGMVMRFIAVKSLGKLFTVDVTIREQHKIKKDGMYKIIRHPSYSGSLLSFAGFGISLNNWLSFIIIMVLVSFSMLYRIKIEEKMLVEQFGSEYEEYMKNTYRLIPYIY